jgi:hypothetical protein
VPLLVVTFDLALPFTLQRPSAAGGVATHCWYAVSSAVRMELAHEHAVNELHKPLMPWDSWEALRRTDDEAAAEDRISQTRATTRRRTTAGCGGASILIGVMLWE